MPKMRMRMVMMMTMMMTMLTAATGTTTIAATTIFMMLCDALKEHCKLPTFRRARTQGQILHLEMLDVDAPPAGHSFQHQCLVSHFYANTCIHSWWTDFPHDARQTIANRITPKWQFTEHCVCAWPTGIITTTRGAVVAATSRCGTLIATDMSNFQMEAQTQSHGGHVY